MSVRATMIRMARAEALEMARNAPLTPWQLEAWVSESVARVEPYVADVERAAAQNPSAFERSVVERRNDVFGLMRDMRIFVDLRA